MMVEDVEPASLFDRQFIADQHADWFKGEVERAIREADDPTAMRISNEEVKAKWNRQRVELVKRAGVFRD
jgi:hypothetical protein